MKSIQVLRIAAVASALAFAEVALAGDLTISQTGNGSVHITPLPSNTVTATDAGAIFDTENNAFVTEFVLYANANFAGVGFISTGDASAGTGDLTVLDSLDFYDADFTGTNTLELYAARDILFFGAVQHNSLTDSPVDLTMRADNDVSLVADQAHINLGGGWLNVQAVGLASLKATWMGIRDVDVTAGEIDISNLSAAGNIHLSADSGPITAGDINSDGAPGDNDVQLSSEGLITVNGDISGGRLTVATNSGNPGQGTSIAGSVQVDTNIDFSRAGPIFIGGSISGTDLTTNDAQVGDTFESGEIVVESAELRSGGDVQINGKFEATTGHIVSNSDGFGSPLFDTDIRVEGSMIASRGIELAHRSVYIGDYVLVMPPEAQPDQGFKSYGSGTFEAVGSIYAHTGEVTIDHQGDIRLHDDLTADFNNASVQSYGTISAQNVVAEFDVSIGSQAGTVTADDLTARYGFVTIESDGDATFRAIQSESGLQAVNHDSAGNGQATFTAHDLTIGGGAEFSGYSQVSLGAVRANIGELEFVTDGDALIDGDVEAGREFFLRTLGHVQINGGVQAERWIGEQYSGGPNNGRNVSLTVVGPVAVLESINLNYTDDIRFESAIGQPSEPLKPTFYAFSENGTFTVGSMYVSDASIEARHVVISGDIYSDQQISIWGTETMQFAENSLLQAGYAAYFYGEGRVDLPSVSAPTVSFYPADLDGQFYFKPGSTLQADEVHVDHNTVLYSGSTAIEANLIYVDYGTLQAQQIGVGGSQLEVYGTVAPYGGEGSEVAQLDVLGDAVFYTSTAALEFGMTDAEGDAGSQIGWDFINVDGIVTLDNTGGPLMIRIESLLDGTTPGLVANFDPHTDQSWDLLIATGGIVGFAPDLVVPDMSEFMNPFNGQFSITSDGYALTLSYTSVPEPTWLGAMFLFTLGAQRKRRRRN